MLGDPGSAPTAFQAARHLSGRRKIEPKRHVRSPRPTVRCRSIKSGKESCAFRFQSPRSAAVGERAGIRTLDLLIKSQLLYRLSYALPAAARAASGGRTIVRWSALVNRPVLHFASRRLPWMGRVLATTAVTAASHLCEKARETPQKDIARFRAALVRLMPA